MRIKHKLSISHGIIAIFMVAQFILSYYALVFLGNVLEDSVKDKLTALIHVSDATGRLGVIRSEEVDASMASDFYATERHLDKIIEEKAKVADLVEKITQTKTVSGNLEVQQKLVNSWTSYRESLDKTTDLINTDEAALALKNQRSSSSPRYDVLKYSLTQIMDVVSGEAEASQKYAAAFVTNQTMILLALSVVGFIVSFLLAFLISSSLSRRIHILREATADMEKGVREKIVVKGGDELSEFGDRFNTMSDKVLSLIEEIEEHNRTLEEKVRLRTRHIKAVLDSMKQGVFTIDMHGKIEDEYSKYLEALVEKESLGGKNIVDAILGSTDLQDDTMATLKSLFLLSIGEDDLNFSMNEEQFPVNFYFDSKDGGKKKFEAQWDPVLTEDDIVERILVTLRDITELEKLIADNRKNAKEVKIITEILNVSNQKFSEFVESSQDYIETAIQANFENTGNSGDDEGRRKLILRNLHTIKGNGRSLGLAEAVEVVHHVEQDLIETKESAVDSFVQNKLVEVQSALGEYKEIYENKILSRASEPSESGELFTYSRDFIESLDGDMTSEKIEKAFLKFKNQFVRLSGVLLSQALEGEKEALVEISGTMNKAAPVVVFTGAEVLLKKDFQGKIQSIFSHILKNSLAHGIETPDVRRQAEKPDEGKIIIDSSYDSEKLIVCVGDDGGGLNLNGLTKKFGDSFSDEQLASKIFESGVTTASAVSDVAGRGVGMDAVKSFVEEIGGSIQIVFTEPRRETGFRGFKLELIFKNNVYTPMESTHSELRAGA